MMIKLQQVINNIEYQIVEQVEDIFNIFDRKQRVLRDLHAELGPFLWCQIFKSKLKSRFKIKISNINQSYGSFSRC